MSHHQPSGGQKGAKQQLMVPQKSYLVNWCFELSQPKEIISGLPKRMTKATDTQTETGRVLKATVRETNLV